MRTHLATALVVLFATAGCEIRTESPVSAISPALDINRGSVPFSATFSGEARFDPPAAPTRAIFEGSGEATHLGTTVNMGVLAPLTFVPVPECALGVGIPHTHLETLSAANGDQLSLEMIDLACPDDQTFMRFHGTGNWTVTGGSGRFADATGSGTAAGHADFIEGVFEINLDGQLTY